MAKSADVKPSGMSDEEILKVLDYQRSKDGKQVGAVERVERAFDEPLNDSAFWNTTGAIRKAFGMGDAYVKEFQHSINAHRGKGEAKLAENGEWDAPTLAAFKATTAEYNANGIESVDQIGIMQAQIRAVNPSLMQQVAEKLHLPQEVQDALSSGADKGQNALASIAPDMLKKYLGKSPHEANVAMVLAYQKAYNADPKHNDETIGGQVYKAGFVPLEETGKMDDRTKQAIATDKAQYQAQAAAQEAQMKALDNATPQELAAISRIMNKGYTDDTIAKFDRDQRIALVKEFKEQAIKQNAAPFPDPDTQAPTTMKAFLGETGQMNAHTQMVLAKLDPTYAAAGQGTATPPPEKAPPETATTGGPAAAVPPTRAAATDEAPAHGADGKIAFDPEVLKRQKLLAEVEGVTLGGFKNHENDGYDGLDGKRGGLTIAAEAKARELLNVGKDGDLMAALEQNHQRVLAQGGRQTGGATTTVADGKSDVRKLKSLEAAVLYKGSSDPGFAHAAEVLTRLMNPTQATKGAMSTAEIQQELAAFKQAPDMGPVVALAHSDGGPKRVLRGQAV